ncbi:MAG TPA: hypothetical protein VN840_15560 [Streptosporangiaceae bacterium]|nr:hypothetical protein [Streptosporangiaceae bacterium]
MSLPTARRRAAYTGATALSAVALAVGLSAGAASAQVPRQTAPSAANPYAPAYHHPYRHGAVPTISRLRAMSRWLRQHPGVRATSAQNLTYGGGIDGIGVTTGPEKVYLVFFGSQWGTKGTDGHGNLTLSHDPSGIAPYLQRLLKGLGTNGDSWSGVATQYCDGAPVNAQSCAADTLHVAYPAGGALRGVWADEGAASPGHATAHQLAAEAVKAAKHFKNTSAASNRDAQYVIVSPTGTHPDGFPSTGFCAWHDWNGDRALDGGGAVTSHYGPIAFTNMPYLTDTNVCGENFVNSGPGGLLDGVSMVEGHEYTETITDQLPPGGWVAPNGEETGDLCAWDEGPGAPAADLALSTGSFAMQSLWGNDGNGGAGTCEFSHVIVRNSGIFNGGFETGSFEGWTTGGAATAIVRTGVHTGRFAARAGKPTPTKGSSSIAQTFNASGVNLSFWFNMTCPDTVSKSWGTVTLTDNTTHATVTLLAKRCIKHSGWRQVSHTIVTGHSYTLTLTSHDDHDTSSKDGAFTLLDGVTNS